MIAKIKLKQWAVNRLVANSHNTIMRNVFVHIVEIEDSKSEKWRVSTVFDLTEKKFLNNSEERLQKFVGYKDIIHAIKNDLHRIQITRDLAKLKGAYNVITDKLKGEEAGE